MIQIATEAKNFYLVKLETGCQAAQVDGYHLTPDLAAEIGFEKITGIPDAIESVKFLEDAGEWSVYRLKWAYQNKDGFARVYVRKVKPPKEAKAVIPRRAFAAPVIGHQVEG